MTDKRKPVDAEAWKVNTNAGDESDLRERTRAALERSDDARRMSHGEAMKWLRDSVRTKKKIPIPWK